jgi:hypothetical protein
MASCALYRCSLACSTAAGDTQLLSLRVLIGTVMGMTVAMFGAKAFIDAKVLQPALKSLDGAATPAAAGAKPAGKKKKKSKGSFGEGIEVLKKSPKIRNLALLVMSYGVGHRCGFTDIFLFCWVVSRVVGVRGCCHLQRCQCKRGMCVTNASPALLSSMLCFVCSACTCITYGADDHLATHPLSPGYRTRKLHEPCDW